MTQVLEHGRLTDTHFASHRLEFQPTDKAQFDHAPTLLWQVIANDRIYFLYSSLVRPVRIIVLVHLCEI